MDEIARALSVSKKTIYQHFKDKGEIVMAFAERHMELQRQVLDELCASGENAIDEMLKVSRWVRQMFESMHPGLIFDIRKFYPKVWERFQEFEDEFLCGSVADNLRRGIREGFYRENLNIEVLVKARLKTVEIICGSNEFPQDQFPQSEVHMALLEHFIRGVLTPKGLTLFEESWEENYSKTLPES